uniref:Uncharacterized protein n=1 Tax=Populus trichocarpa TaxID=3694 RepID=A0A3N7ED46_POPTR
MRELQNGLQILLPYHTHLEPNNFKELISMFAPTRPINNLSQLSHCSILALAGKYHIHIEVSCRHSLKNVLHFTELF